MIETVISTKVDLQTYLEHENIKFSFGNDCVGVYVSSVHQKMNAFVQHIIKAPSSGIVAEDYFTMLVFDLDGNAKLVGLIWPSELEEINVDIASNNGKLNLKTELISFIEKNISVSSDPRILRSVLNISEKESQELSELVKEYQTHICDDVLCDLCSSPELPSLDTLLPEASSRANFETLTKLLHQIK